MRTMSDPITGEIIQNRLQQIGHEGGLVLQHCAVSPGVVEAKDLGFNIADAHGRTIVYSTWMPRHGTTLAYMLESCKRRFEGDIRPGDMYLVNDPHAGALHSLDLAVIAPVFVDGRLVAWVGNATHHIDVGAMSPGRAPLATDWFQEGMIFRPIRLVQDGIIRSDIFDLFLDNVRMPRYQSLDLKAQISANVAASAKLTELVRRYGADTFQRACDESLDISEGAARDRIRSLKEGRYEFVEHLDYDQAYKIRGTLEVRDGELHFDLAGTDPQSTTFINCALPCAVANMHNILACQLFPDLTVNEGAFRPISIEVPPGTLLSCDAPAPCSGASTITGWKAQQLTMGLLSQALLGTEYEYRAQAQWGWGFTDVQWTGKDASGRTYIMRGDQTMHGGGGRATVDGIDVSNIAGSTNTAITSVESYEQRYPVLYLFRGIAPDSGGAGQYRGGVAGDWARVLYGVDEAADLSFYIGRDFGAAGFAGGLDGQPSHISIKRGTDLFERLDTSVPSFTDLAGEAEVLPQQPKALDCVVRAGDVVYVRGMGGGGYGNPAERDRKALLDDVRDGFVSEALARSTYGSSASGVDGRSPAQARQA
jgi:N-methylhydantoinase B